MWFIIVKYITKFHVGLEINSVEMLTEITMYKCTIKRQLLTTWKPQIMAINIILLRSHVHLYDIYVYI